MSDRNDRQLPTLPVHVPGLHEMAVKFDEGPPWPSKTFHVPSWYRKGDGDRLKLLRKYAEEYGRDPRLREFVINDVLRPAGVLFPSRQYVEQSKAMLKWVQDNIAYLNEPGEQLQGPWHTLKVKLGDCDDLSLLLASMAESIRIPWRFVLAGKDSKGQKVRYEEKNGPPPRGVKFHHIFLDLGDKPFTPDRWIPAEPSAHVPLGHDVVASRFPGRGLAGILDKFTGTGGKLSILKIAGQLAILVTVSVLSQIAIKYLIKRTKLRKLLKG